jgi:methionyl-tRNA formyltransferase
MGTPEFAVPTLEALLESRHEVVGVFTNPDRRSGRGKKVHPSPVKAAAVAAGVPVYQPRRVRGNDEALETLRAWAPDVTVVAAYGQILPVEILEVAPMGSLNVHASLLPKYRGAAPINWCIVRGEDATGITIMRMEAGLDTGPMLLEESVEITPEMTSAELHDLLAPMGGPMVLRALDGLLDGSITPRVQDHDAATWAPMIKKEDGAVDFSGTARQVADHIRGFNPWPGAYASHVTSLGSDEQPSRIKLHRARVVEDASVGGQPGEVLEASGDALVVACGEGAVAMLELQAPGKRAMGARDFMNGFNVMKGQFFV